MKQTLIPLKSAPDKGTHRCQRSRTNSPMASGAVNSTSSWGPVLNGAFCSSPHTLPLFTAWFLLYLLSFPVFLSALYVLYRKWKRPRPLSHSDAFTAHLLLVEVVHLLGCCCIFHGVHTKALDVVVSLGMVLFHTAHSGRICFHNLTCVERYLAVVHPITYLRLKKGAGVTFRNAHVGLAWLFCVGLAALTYIPLLTLFYQITLACALLAFMLTSFCTSSVFCVLIRPGPGKGGGDRRSISQSKRAALHTMAFILGAQMLNIVNTILFYILGIIAPDGVDLCLLSINSLWLEFPNSLVLPLLFLYRAKKKV